MSLGRNMNTTLLTHLIEEVRPDLIGECTSSQKSLPAPFSLQCDQELYYPDERKLFAISILSNFSCGLTFNTASSPPRRSTIAAISFSLAVFVFK